MIEIVSHRGHWLSPQEQNREIAFRRSFAGGFGTETDIRDHQGDLRISHDVVRSDDCLSLEDFLGIHAECAADLPLFLNIKCDGIGEMLADKLEAFSVRDCFVFDMSVPETVRYRKSGRIGYLARMSDVETIPYLVEDAAGIWVDGFFGDGPAAEEIEAVVGDHHLVCFVSPELHGRDETGLWDELRAWRQPSSRSRSRRVLLCTDHPLKAADFFRVR